MEVRHIFSKLKCDFLPVLIVSLAKILGISCSSWTGRKPMQHYKKTNFSPRTRSFVDPCLFSANVGLSDSTDESSFLLTLSNCPGWLLYLTECNSKIFLLHLTACNSKIFHLFWLHAILEYLSFIWLIKILKYFSYIWLHAILKYSSYILLNAIQKYFT